MENGSSIQKPIPIRTGVLTTQQLSELSEKLRAESQEDAYPLKLIERELLKREQKALHYDADDERSDSGDERSKNRLRPSVTSPSAQPLSTVKENKEFIK